MEFKVKLPLLLSICAFLLLIASGPIFAAPQNTPENVDSSKGDSFHKSLENFSNQLFSKFMNANSRKNIILSPFSIQTCIAMARMGAQGQTAQEINQGMGLTSAINNYELAEKYHTILADYEKSNVLKVANKIYIMDKYELKEKFNELLTKKFFSSAESIDFTASEQAAKTINTWVESKTNNKIKDLVTASALDADTRLVLVNAIYFKGDWLHPFPEHATKELDFYLDDSNTVRVQMMHNSERLRYGQFHELDATALELPYENSDLSMLIILPNSRTGLDNLEEKLMTISIPDLLKEMHLTTVKVGLPKFKAEFEVELSDTLSKMGMIRMFSNSAEFGQMLKSDDPLKISKIMHKAFIEVNEKGTEAAAATDADVLPYSMPKIFNANKPFHYSILNKKGIVLFNGNIKTF